LKEQETELDARRSELQKLKEEEAALEREYDDGLKEMENLSHQLQDTQLQISQVKAMVSQLEEIQRQMTDALAMCRGAIEANDPMLVTEYSLKIEPEFREFKQALEKKAEPAAVADPFSEGGAKVESSC
jgi:epidermal growth factor receptor substrate 15